MINRKITPKVKKSLKNFPVTGLLGSRQTGKTTLAKTIQKDYKNNAVYLDLELDSDLSKLREPELYLKQHEDKLVIIDEIQRMPGLFPLLRALVDRKKKNGRFLILGSASPDLIRKSSESLAGRIAYHELSPFILSEIKNTAPQINRVWLRGGYPDSFLAKNDEISFKWRENFIKTYLERDIPQLGINIPSARLKKFLTMLAHSHGQIVNTNKLAASLGVSYMTISSYLDIFESTFIIRRLQPFYANLKKRLVKKPKIYIRDSGLLHALLRNETLDDLQSHPGLGSSWEGFVIEQICEMTIDRFQPYFIRSNTGTEIDLILQGKKGHSIAIEIKYSLSPELSKGFWNTYHDLSLKRGYIIYPGEEKYLIGKNIYALPISQVCKELTRLK